MKSAGIHCLFFLLIISSSYAQVYEANDLKKSDYLEDQFYIATAYNFLLDRPEGVVQRSLSYNLQAGFIKDLPINARRNVALGIGLGYGVNSYYTNVEAIDGTTDVTYTLSNREGFRRSKFETHALELPLELRWRTSTDTEYKFWRIYAGVKLAYAFVKRSKIASDTFTNGFDNDDIQNLQYGLMLNFGFNTWNIHAYYALNPLLEDNVSLESGVPFELRTLRIGLIFYIL